MKIVIAHLYPDLLNLYGDRGNIQCMAMRSRWRGIEAEVKEYRLQDAVDFSGTDIILLGGGSDREQQIVCTRLQDIRKEMQAYVEDGGTVLAVCGGYQLLGHYYDTPDGRMRGLSLVDLYTEQGDPRLISNVVLQSEELPYEIVGFENHGGRTYIGENRPFGHVVHGYGNNGTDGREGVLYKNVIGTYLHGPLLPKNPHVCDRVLQHALERKYGISELAPLDDTQEREANRYIVNRFHAG
ncbi:MAG: glutamine amidotransferase [Eubacterium sp.]|nr:glutamine amidotransferase [Eubacterium sp.]